MENIFKKLTEEIKQQLMASLSVKENQDLIVETKAKTDTGNFKFIASTPAVDRQGESIDQGGWELENYLKNSVLLWAHDYSQPPIGVVDKIGLENGNLVIEGRFAPTDFAQQIRKLYDLQMVNTVSVGFIPKEMNGNIITKSELLEVSVVPVPANPQAVSIRQLTEAGIQLEMLKTKGFEIKEVETEQKPENKTSDLETQLKELQAEITSLKAGRVLSEKNRTLIKNTIDGLSAVTIALTELYDATEGDKQVNLPSQEGETAKIKLGAEDIKAMDQWLLIKRLTGTAVTALSEAGAVLNKKINAQK
jgi:HK97 family phage prohead protease